MKVLVGNEKVEKPIEMILPLYVFHKYKLIWCDIDLTLEQYESLESNLNEFKTVVTLDYIVKSLSEDERQTFELLTYIEPFNAKETDIFSRRHSENHAALKLLSKSKGYDNAYDNAYLNEKLAPMFPGKKSIPKKIYKSMLESIEKGLEEVQEKLKTGDLTVEIMLGSCFTI